MVTVYDINRIDDALIRNELSSYCFVERLNARLYDGVWDDKTQRELEALCAPIHDRFRQPKARSANADPSYDNTRRSSASSSADDAFRAARRNFIHAILEYKERNSAENPRSPMEIMRDKAEAARQLVALLCFTGFMGKELAQEHVRTFERLVEAQISPDVGTRVGAR